MNMGKVIARGGGGNSGNGGLDESMSRIEFDGFVGYYFWAL